MTTIANMDLETATLDQLENLTISDLLGQNLADVELRSTLPDGTYIFAFDKSAVKAFAADPEKNKKASINLNLFLKVVRCIQCADPEMDPASLTNRVHIQQFPMHMAHGPANAAMLILGVLGVPFKDKAAMAEAGGTMGELLETMINEKLVFGGQIKNKSKNGYDNCDLVFSEKAFISAEAAPIHLD